MLQNKKAICEGAIKATSWYPSKGLTSRRKLLKFYNTHCTNSNCLHCTYMYQNYISFFFVTYLLKETKTIDMFSLSLTLFQEKHHES